MTDLAQFENVTPVNPALGLPLGQVNSVLVNVPVSDVPLSAVSLSDIPVLPTKLLSPSLPAIDSPSSPTGIPSIGVPAIPGLPGLGKRQLPASISFPPGVTALPGPTNPPSISLPASLQTGSPSVLTPSSLPLETPEIPVSSLSDVVAPGLPTTPSGLPGFPQSATGRVPDLRLSGVVFRNFFPVDQAGFTLQGSAAEDHALVATPFTVRNSGYPSIIADPADASVYSFSVRQEYPCPRTLLMDMQLLNLNVGCRTYTPTLFQTTSIPVPCNVTVSCSGRNPTFAPIEDSFEYTPALALNAAISDGPVWELSSNFSDVASCVFDVYSDETPLDELALLVDDVKLSLGLCEPEKG